MRQKVFWKNPGYHGYPTLEKNISCNYLIIGGGIVGVSLVYFLARRGIKDIVLIEKETIASGATGRAAGMLVIGMERIGLAPFLKRYGLKKSLIYWASQVASLLALTHIIKTERIDCDADLEPYYVLGSSGKNAESVRKEYLTRKAMHQKVKHLIGKELKREFNLRGFSEGERIHWALSVNPLKLTQNLSKVAAKYGAKVFEHTPIVQSSGNTAMTPRARINFRHVIYAVDAFTKERQIKKTLTTIAVTQPLSGHNLHNLHLKPGMFEDTETRDYHYAKVMKNQRLLVGYGNLHLKNAVHHPKLEKAHLKNIKKFLRRHLPGLGLQVDYAWSGIMANPKPWFPIVKFGRKKITIAGAGTQIFGVMLARYTANRLLGRKQALDIFFR